MPTLNNPAAPPEVPIREKRSGGRARGIGTHDALQLVRLVQHGFPFSRLASFQKATQFPWDTIARLVAIPPRTIARRQSQGRLRPDESDRVWRAAALFDRTVDLFEGDVAAARRWLQAPQAGLGGQTPLDFASTEVGAREVERLLGRLEDGVFA